MRAAISVLDGGTVVVRRERETNWRVETLTEGFLSAAKVEISSKTSVMEPSWVSYVHVSTWAPRLRPLRPPKREAQLTEAKTASSAFPSASSTLAFFSFVLARSGETVTSLNPLNAPRKPIASFSKHAAAMVTHMTLASVILPAKARTSSS